jgi:hypothetical protein
MVSYCPTCADAVLGRGRDVERGDPETREASKGLLEVLNARLEREAAQLERDRADHEEKNPIPDRCAHPEHAPCTPPPSEPDVPRTPERAYPGRR